MSYFVGDRLSCNLKNISSCWYLHLRSLLLVIVIIFKRNNTKVYINCHDTFGTITNVILINNSKWSNASTTYFEWYGTNIFLGSSSFHTTYTLTLFFDTKKEYSFMATFYLSLVFYWQVAQHSLCRWIYVDKESVISKQYHYSLCAH